MPFKIFSAALRSDDLKQIECGSDFSGFLTASGNAYVFGDNSCGQLAIMDDNENMPLYSSEPVICRLSNIHQMSLGYKHSLFLTSEGKVFGAG